MLLSEIFNSKVDLEIDENTRVNLVCHANIDNQKYVFDAYLKSESTITTDYLRFFNKDDDIHDTYVLNEPVWDIVFGITSPESRMYNYEYTKKYNATTVISFVKQCIQILQKERNAEWLAFNCEDKRQRFYMKLFKSMLPNAKIYTNRSNHNIHYTLVNIG